MLCAAKGPAFLRRFVSTDEENDQRVRRDFSDKAARFSQQLPFVENAAAMYYCAVARDLPKRVNIAIFAALAYFVVPADLIPDVVAVTGYLDEGIVLARTFNYVRTNVTEWDRSQVRDAIARGIISCRKQAYGARRSWCPAPDDRF